MKTRAAIVGTARSWSQCPFDDPSLYIVSLNDAWVMGLPRADEWCEYHPLEKFWFRDPANKFIDPRQVPAGHYIRPRGHLEWLQKFAMTNPVWLQQEPPAGWPPNAKRLPLEHLEAKYGAYWASGPSYMLLHLYERGFREFQIYGIHLETNTEWAEQRPNFEFLIGRLLGPELRMRVEGKRRIYDGANGVRLVLPVDSPVLQHPWRYAIDPKPHKTPHPYEDELKAVRKEKQALVDALVFWPAGKDKSRQIARLQRLMVIELDCQNQLMKRNAGGTLTAQLAA